MTDQQALTREELEAAGYRIVMDVMEHRKNIYIAAPDGWRTHSMELWNADTSIPAQLLDKATAHYQQQQELARLRELDRVVANILETYEFHGVGLYDGMDALKEAYNASWPPTTEQN